VLTFLDAVAPKKRRRLVFHFTPRFENQQGPFALKHGAVHNVAVPSSRTPHVASFVAASLIADADDERVCFLGKSGHP
jgi:hypothetical protein